MKWAGSLTDEELENEYYRSVYDSLGSQTDEMYESGYDIRDIKEYETYKKYLIEKSDISGSLCGERNIVLWE